MRFAIILVLVFLSMLNSQVLADNNSVLPDCLANQPATTNENTTQSIATRQISKYCPLVGGEKAALRGIKLSGKAQLFEQDQLHYRIGCGCALIQCNSETLRIDTCHAQVFAKRGAAFVVDNGGANSMDTAPQKERSSGVAALPDSITRVLNLSDHERDSVRVVLGNRHISLNPGEELIVVRGTRGQADRLIQYSSIKFRRPTVTPLDENMQIVVFEFSLGDALKNCAIFTSLSASPLDSDHKLLNDLIKTAAAVNTMFAKNREKYTNTGTQQEPATRTAENSRRI